MWQLLMLLLLVVVVVVVAGLAHATAAAAAAVGPPHVHATTTFAGTALCHCGVLCCGVCCPAVRRGPAVIAPVWSWGQQGPRSAPPAAVAADGRAVSV